MSGQSSSPHRRTRQHFGGCLLGGAVGDALGAPVEFLSLQEIRDTYGPEGIREYDSAYGRRGAITDDTQMTLFTAEGLLRAGVRWRQKGHWQPAPLIHHAYIRWLHTQQASSLASSARDGMDGWLFHVEGLHACRAPGRTCLSALRGTRMGTVDEPLNDSKGCGGVMRVAPIGLLSETDVAAFALGCDAAAITHGHPSGYYSAGCFAAIIHNLTQGSALSDAIERALQLLADSKNAGHDECSEALRCAITLSQNASLAPSPEAVERLGGGWVGEQALAIALYCALSAHDDFARGVLLAVNHSGDCDSTAAMAGTLLGLMLGVDAIPARWVDGLELRHEIEAVAHDLYTGFDGSDAWSHRYPGW